MASTLSQMAAPPPRPAFVPQARRKEGQRVKGVCQPSLSLCMRKAIALLEATPAGFWSALLAGTGHMITTGCKGAWEGNLLSGTLSHQTRPGTSKQGSIVKNEGGVVVEGGRVCLGTIIYVLLIRNQHWRSFQTSSKPCAWSMGEPEPPLTHVGW